MPSAYTQLMVAADFAIGPSYEVVIAGDLQADDTRKMLEAIRRLFAPNKIVILRPTDEKSPEIDVIASFIKDYTSKDGKVTAYVCLDYNCKLPTEDMGSVLRLIGSDQALESGAKS